MEDSCRSRGNYSAARSEAGGPARAPAPARTGLRKIKGGFLPRRIPAFPRLPLAANFYARAFPLRRRFHLGSPLDSHGAAEGRKPRLPFARRTGSCSAIKLASALGAVLSWRAASLRQRRAAEQRERERVSSYFRASVGRSITKEVNFENAGRENGEEGMYVEEMQDIY